MLYPHVLSSGRLVFYPHKTTEWFCGSNRGAQVCFHVYSQYTDVLLLVWLGKLSHRTKLIPLNTCLMASLQLPSQTVTKHACSRQDQSECSFTASEHIRDALHDLCFLLCCIWLCIYTYPHTQSVIFLSLLCHLSLSIRLHYASQED